MSKVLSQVRNNLLTAQRLVAKHSHTLDFKPVPIDWVEFAKLLTIQSGDKFTNYNPYPYQIELDKTFDSHPTTIGIKSRQMGWTTYAAAKGLHKAILNPAYTAIYVSQTQNDASLIAHTVRKMLQSIPEYAVPLNDNLLVQRIRNGGTLHFRSPGPNATRGIPSVSDLFIDEAAFIDDIELLYGQIKNTQSMVGENARTLIISTPNTVSDWFYEKLTTNSPEILKLIKDVREGIEPPIKILEDAKSGWAKFICHWKAHPIYSQYPDYLERCAEKDQLPIEQVYQERDLSFESNMDNVFTYQMVNDACCIPEFTREYNSESEYFLGIDTATTGQDYFVCVVIEKEDEKQYRLTDWYRARAGSTNTHLFEVGKLIKKYKPHRVSIEVNAGGQNYFDLIQENFPSQDIKPVRTTNDSKAKMISRLCYLFERHQLRLINEKVIRDEFFGFQRNGNKFEAISGKHDDIVMSVAIACDGIPIFNL